MRLVVDTNVVVSGLINGAGSPGKVVDAVLRGEIIIVHTELILAEYRDVLYRSKFSFEHEEVRSFVEAVQDGGEWINPEVSSFSLPDPKDRPFLDAALWIGCPIVTGNMRHFPAGCGATILTPAECLAKLITG